MLSKTDSTLGNSFSLKRFFKGLLLVALSTLAAGISGLLTVLLMFWFTRQNFAVDSHEKHGISNQQASRLGGVAVAFCAFCVYWISISLPLGVESLDRMDESLLSTPAFYALVIGAVGFCDDVFGRLSPRIRIALTAIIFSACLLINPDYIPSNIGMPFVDSLLDIYPMAFVLCLIACVGMLNATNMADGANGLMPLVFMGTFFGFALITGELIYFALTMALMVFALFNVLSGKLFLGDSGSYGLGALAAIGAIKIMSATGAEVWLFLCLAAYPVIDFFASVTRRMLAGRSPLSADSDHMHNRLYRFFRKMLFSPLAANSVSGITIGIGTTGVAVVLLKFWSATSNNWIGLFAVYIAVYLAAFVFLNSNKAINND